MSKQQSRLKFFQRLLNRDISDMRDAVNWLEQRTDSQLETMFGISFLSIFRESGDGCIQLAYDLQNNHIRLADPYAFSPTANGASAAFLRAQESHEGRTWDFAIYTAGDNGADFTQSKLAAVIDIDGFNVHQSRRKLDALKSASASVKSIRICEELFTSVNQMALAALYSTIWSCDCACVEDQSQIDCYVCSSILSRVR